MATSNLGPDKTQLNSQAFTPIAYQEQHLRGPFPSNENPEQIIAHRRVLRAAKTRALRTYKGFSQERIDSLAPSNCFTILKISSQKLKRCGVPTIKTRWEERLKRQRVNPFSENSGVETVIQQAYSLVEVHDAVATCSNGTIKNEEKTRLAAEAVMEITRSPANQGATLRWPVPISLVPKCVALGDPNFDSFPLEHSTTRAISNHQLLHTETEACSTFNPPIKRAQIATDSDTNGEQGTCLTTRSLPHSFRSEAIKSVLETRCQVNEQAGEDAQIERTVNCDKTDTKHDSTVCEESDVLTKQHRHSVSSSSSSTKSIESDSSFERSCLTKAHPATLEATAARSFKIKFVGLDREQRPKSFEKNPSVPNPSILTRDMAPVRDPNNVDSSLKDAIQKLYEVQSQVHGFVPETQPLLIEKMTELARSLDHIQMITSPTLSPNNPIHKNRIAPEVIDYVDDSRNPDIYNREFIELVQRGNAVMNGKQQAFRDFSEIFAKALKDGMPELNNQVDKVMKNAKAGSGNTSRSEEDGTNRAERANGRTDVRKDAETGANGTS